MILFPYYCYCPQNLFSPKQISSFFFFPDDEKGAALSRRRKPKHLHVQGRDDH